MKIVFMGTPDFAVPPLEALIGAGHDIAAVVTQPDRPKGRGRGLAQSPVKACAAAHDLPVLQPERAREPEFLAKIRELAPELIATAAFGQILPKALLEIPPLGCLNVHASLLPLYRGAAPIQRAILDGRTETGITIMLMDEGLDTGDILLQESTPIFPEDTGGSLFDRLSRMGADCLCRVVEQIRNGESRPQPQQGESIYASMLKKEEGEIDWSLPSADIERRIRAFSPWPGAFTRHHGRLWKLHKASVAPASGEAEPGEITGVSPQGIEVRCGEGSLLLTEIQPEGKRCMTVGEYLLGNDAAAGERLGK